MSANGNHILAIDLGTSGAKVALASARGEILAHKFSPVELLLSPGGGAEQDPDAWWRAIVEATRGVLAAHPVPAESVAAVCCSCHWSGTVAVGRDGRHLMNGLLWLDSRGSPHVRRISRGLVNIQGYGATKLLRWVRLTGGAPAPSGKDPLAHILFIRHERPEVYRQTHKFLEPKDYINLRLTGKFTAGHDSIAIHWVTDNRDLSRVDYDEGLLRLTTLEREKLPDLMPPSSIVGPLTAEAARELGLTERAKVVMGGPDTHAAPIGAGAVRDFDGDLYIGTSSWLTCHVPFKKIDIAHNMASLPSSIPGRYLLLNDQETAGACVNFLRDNVLYPKDAFATGEAPEDFYDRLNAAAASVTPGSGKTIFTPWLYGERTPIEDHSVRGAFYNLSLSTTRAHLARAVMEGVAYNSRWLLECVERFNGRPFEAVNMIGGGANSDLWCQICADVTNRKMRQVKNPIQANARGAAFMAAVAMGYLTWDEIPGLVEIEKTFEPEKSNRGIYDELFKEYTSIYRANKSIYGRLNRK